MGDASIDVIMPGGVTLATVQHSYTCQLSVSGSPVEIGTAVVVRTKRQKKFLQNQHSISIYRSRNPAF